MCGQSRSVITHPGAWCPGRHRAIKVSWKIECQKGEFTHESITECSLFIMASYFCQSSFLKLTVILWQESERDAAEQTVWLQHRLLLPALSSGPGSASSPALCALPSSFLSQQEVSRAAQRAKLCREPAFGRMGAPESLWLKVTQSVGAARSPRTGPDSLQHRPPQLLLCPKGLPFLLEHPATGGYRVWVVLAPVPSISAVHFWLLDVLNFLTCLPQCPSSSFPTVGAHSSTLGLLWVQRTLWAPGPGPGLSPTAHHLPALLTPYVVAPGSPGS